MRINVGILLFLLAAVVNLISSTGCKKAQPNPNDKTPPTVEIVYRNPAETSEYKTASATQKFGSGPQLDIICRFKDPEGVKSVFGDVNVAVKNCEQNGICQQGCSCPLPDPTPAYLHALQPDAQGNVPTYTVFATSVTAGTPPFCQNNPQKKVVGAEYTVVCQATNYGAQQTQETAKFIFGIVGPC